MFVGLAALLLGVVAAIKGSLPSLRLTNRKQAAAIMAASFVVLLAGGAMAEPLSDPGQLNVPQELPSPSPDPSPSPGSSDVTTSQTQTAASQTAPPTRPAVPEQSRLSQPKARPEAVPAEAQEAVVVRHVDGDTIWAEGGTLPSAAVSKIRLLEIDAPEMNPVECFGPESSAFLKSELPVGSKIFLLADREDKDRYGRFLRYIWKQNGEFLNDKAVRNGFAKALLVSPNDRYIAGIRTAQAEAKAARKGIWAACTAAVPPPPLVPLAAPPQGPASVPPLSNAVVAPPSSCDASYPDFCIPPGPPDLDCGDVSGRRFTVLAPDPHGFDGEKDGIGCESG